MNGKKARRARAVAYKEAQRQKIWDNGIKQVREKWLKALAFKLFPKYRSRLFDKVSRWYKINLKRWAKQYAASIHDPVIKAYAKARAKEERRRRRENNGRPILIRPAK